MNKLILIGNGFDKAHGLPTSYTDFINDFWRELKINFKEKHIKELVSINGSFTGFFDYDKIENYQDLIKNLGKYSNEYNHGFDPVKPLCISRTDSQGKISSNVIFEFKNNFFRQLNIKNSLLNWVDIENEYYETLKYTLKMDHIPKNDKIQTIIKLNKEFEQIKKLLEKYLREKIFNNYDFKNLGESGWYDFYEILKPFLFYVNKPTMLDEFTRKEDKAYLENIIEWEKRGEQKINSNSYLLNFNYTPTLNVYFSLFKEADVRVNHIHGQVNDGENPINFGFGDEMDEDYKLIENTNENEYLRNFKSFQYLQNSNYNKLLSYVDSGKFQVYVLGHSCGLSDRTLLNTVFEHENCRSIKVFYHERKNDDNYIEIIQNISRHFDNKQKMRSLVVNKTLCQPMPQIQLGKINK